MIPGRTIIAQGKSTILEENLQKIQVPLSLIREINIMRQLRHKNLVQLVEVVASAKGNPIIIMEECTCSLEQVLQSSQHPMVMPEVLRDY